MSLTRCDLYEHMKKYKKKHCKPIYKLKKEDLVNLLVELGIPISQVEKGKCKKRVRKPVKRKLKAPTKKQFERLYTDIDDSEYQRIVKNFNQSVRRNIKPEEVAIPELTREQEDFLNEGETVKENYRQLVDIANNYNVPTRKVVNGRNVPLSKNELINEIRKVKPQALGSGFSCGGRYGLKRSTYGGCDNPNSFFCPKNYLKREMYKTMMRDL